MLSQLKLKLHNLNDNDKIVYKNVIVSFLIKGGSLVISLLTMPLYISFFNNETTLGLWFTILSLVNWIFAFDLGIGNGLRNKLTESLTKKNDNQSKKYISSAYFAIGILSILLILVFLLVERHINWNAVLNIGLDVVDKDALNIAIRIVFIGMIVQFFLKLITSILYAIQKPFITNLLSFVISLGTLITVLIIPSRDNNTNLIVISLVTILFNIIPYLVCTILLFMKKLRAMIPNIKYVKIKECKEVLMMGGHFFYIQILYMIIIATNEILITRLFNATYVVEYQIYYKLFSLIGTVFTLMLAPIWSVVTKALTEKNFKWIKKLFNKLLLLSCVAALAQFLIIPLMQIIVNIWLKENAIIISYKISFVFAILGTLMVFNGTLSSVANGMNKLRMQTIVYTIGVVLKVIICIILLQFNNHWSIPVIATDIVLFIYCIAQYISNVRAINKNIQNTILEESGEK